MSKIILDFLKKYETDEYSVNRLIVSAFLFKKNIVNVQNQKIKEFIIQKDELEYNSLLNFIRIIDKKFNYSKK